MILLKVHFGFADTQVDIDASFREKNNYIQSLQHADLQANSNAVALANVSGQNIEDYIVDSSDIVFDWCKVLGILDGSGAMDSTAGDGFDTSLSNRVVRTHDTITYRIGYGLQLNESLNENVYRSGKLYLRFVLPVTSDKAVFSEKSLQSIKNANIVTSGNQQILTGEYDLPINDQGFALPCAGRIDLVVQVKNMANNSTLQPTFSMSTKVGTYEKQVIPEAVRVTCRGAYNIRASSVFEKTTSTGSYRNYSGSTIPSSCKLYWNITVAPIEDKDPITGESTPRKGVYFPNRAKYTVTMRNTQDSTSVPYAIYFCDVSTRDGSSGNYGNNLSKPSFELPVKNYCSAVSASVSPSSVTLDVQGIPETGGTVRFATIGRYSSGSHTMGLSFSNPQYFEGSFKTSIGGEMPDKTNSLNIQQSGSWTPYTAFTTMCDASSSTGTAWCSHQIYGDGNSSRGIASGFEIGDAKASRGDELILTNEVNINTQGYYNPRSFNIYGFIDTRGLEILDRSSTGVVPHLSFNNMVAKYGSIRYLYIAKTNGTGFSSDSEMTGLTLDTVCTWNFYSSLAELKSAGKVCVGVVAELRDVRFADTGQIITLDLPIRVKSSASMKSVYIGGTGALLWRDNASVPSHASGRLNFRGYGGMDGVISLSHGPYRKSTYNSDGVMTQNHSNGRHGSSLYINPILARVDMEVAQRDGSDPKSVYRFSEGDRYVWFKITPSYKGALSSSHTWTYTVELPYGLKPYRSLTNPTLGWCYDGGTFTSVSPYFRNGDVTGGTQINPTVSSSDTKTLVTIRKTFGSDADFKPIYMCCSLDGDKIVSGMNYTADVKVTGDGQHVVSEFNRNEARAGVNVILKHSASLVKMGPEQIELGEDLVYTLTLHNQGTTIRNLKLVDLLPSNYSGTTSSTKYIFKSLGIGVSDSGHAGTTQGAAGSGFSIAFRSPENTSNDINTWSTTDNFTNKEITGFGVKGDLDSGNTLTLTITLGIPDACMGEVFYNGFTFEADNFTNSIKSNLVRTYIPIRTAKLTIEKKLKANSYVRPKGNYIFHYRVHSIDDRDTPVVFYKTIEVPEGSSSASITFDLPARVYQIDELDANDWSISLKQAGTNSYLLNPITNWKDIGKLSSKAWTGSEILYSKLDRGGTGKVTFTNMGSYKDYTHNNEVKNNLK